VARYWPEFAQNGKAAITVRQLLGHEAGLVWLEGLSVDKVKDLDGLARALARQRPAWPPGTRHGYHAMTIGLYMQELVRRAGFHPVTCSTRSQGPFGIGCFGTKRCDENLGLGKLPGEFFDPSNSVAASVKRLNDHHVRPVTLQKF